MRRMALKIFIFTDHLVSADHQRSPSALARRLSAFRNLFNSAEQVSRSRPGNAFHFTPLRILNFQRTDCWREREEQPDVFNASPRYYKRAVRFRPQPPLLVPLEQRFKRRGIGRQSIAASARQKSLEFPA